MREIFGKDADEFAELPDIHVPYVLGRLALRSGYQEKQCCGYETILRYFSDPTLAASLAATAGLSCKDLMALAPTTEGSPVKEINDLRRWLKRQKRIRLVWALLVFLTGACLWLVR